MGRNLVALAMRTGIPYSVWEQEPGYVIATALEIALEEDEES
ncbi:hypothetical protein [Rothia sp. L_38]